MLIFLPVMLFPNAPNNVRLCFRNIPVMLWAYPLFFIFYTTQHCLRDEDFSLSRSESTELELSERLGPASLSVVVVHVVVAGTLPSLVAISSGITNKRHARGSILA